MPLLCKWIAEYEIKTRTVFYAGMGSRVISSHNRYFSRSMVCRLTSMVSEYGASFDNISWSKSFSIIIIIHYLNFSQWLLLFHKKIYSIILFPPPKKKKIKNKNKNKLLARPVRIGNPPRFFFVFFYFIAKLKWVQVFSLGSHNNKEFFIHKMLYVL